MKQEGILLLSVKFKTSLSKEELIAVAREREPMFKAIPGIVQKYYLNYGDNEYGGVYVWDAKDSLTEFRQSELAASIPAAYHVIGTPTIEVSEILFQLRD